MLAQVVRVVALRSWLFGPPVSPFTVPALPPLVQRTPRPLLGPRDPLLVLVLRLVAVRPPVVGPALLRHELPAEVPPQELRRAVADPPVSRVLREPDVHSVLLVVLRPVPPPVRVLLGLRRPKGRPLMVPVLLRLLGVAPAVAPNHLPLRVVVQRVV